MAMPEKLPSSKPSTPVSHHLFAAFAGIVVALGLLKFGTPVILDHKVIPPEGLLEVFYHVWPVAWAYPLVVLLALGALVLFRWEKPKPAWPLVLLLVWLGWQFLSAGQTVDNRLTGATLPHFVAATACFLIGYFSLSRIKDLRLFYIFMLLGFVLVLRNGLEQHFGGLERTRLYFYTYILPNLPEPPLEYMQKISTNRIFATLFYPNSFAGAILLFLPICAFAGWQIAERFGRIPQMIIAGMISLAALGCLYWSGSKSGWLIMLGLGLVFLLHTRIPRNYKVALVLAVFILGATGFGLRYMGFFQRGATSVVARFDYWSAAWQIFKANPVLGSGPGTFSVEYLKIKSPESEMARLCHNDYLEQASDSGLIGFLSFTGLILGSLLYLYRYRIEKRPSYTFFVWLGLLGICVQGFSEFNFYIPGLAWPTFLLLGWLWGSTKPVDIAKPAL
ncbi:MAG: O-antigen ligase family protein [Limisphaerales bacterium]